MRKFLFVFVMAFGVVSGIYLGLKYPSDIVCGSLCETAEPTVFESFSANTPISNPTPAEIPKEQFPANISSEPSVTIATTPMPSSSNTESNSYDILGQLIVGSDSITVRDNVEEATLRQSPGWMPDSALPGENGMCVILGHRNRNHLKILENVKIGDEIIFRYIDNRTATYTVTEIQIFEETANWSLPQLEEDLLVIVTCYPFRYSGSAPGKFQIICQKDIN